MKRHTFVVQIHHEGISTLENLSTHERIPLADLSEIGPQIERWLSEQPDQRAAVRPRSAPAPRE